MPYLIVILPAAQSNPEKVLWFFSFVHDLNCVATLLTHIHMIKEKYLQSITLSMLKRSRA